MYGILNTTTSAIPRTAFLATFHSEPLAWFRVEEYSGLTGRKGTTVVSVTKVLWFCVASQTSRKKRAKRQNLTTPAVPWLCWGMAQALRGRLGEAHLEAITCKSAWVMRTVATGQEKNQAGSWPPPTGSTSLVGRRHVTSPASVSRLSTSSYTSMASSSNK